MKHLPALVIVLCAALLDVPAAMAQLNGQVDGIHELVERREWMAPMPDGVGLATDVFLPILQDDLGFGNLTVDVGPFIGLPSLPVQVPYLRMAERGLWLFRYANQPDPLRLPLIFTRTPYNKQDPSQGQLEALLGFAGVVQDMRGRYASEGTYYPMFSDSWAKHPYLQDTAGHALDTTQARWANFHEDGWNSVQWLLTGLRADRDGDGMHDSLVCNGSIGMFGASALANSQFQAAAAHRTDAALPGLKCLMPVVGAGEFYNSTGHHHGLFRERMIEGWLTGQVQHYGQYAAGPDGSVLNGIHTLGDYNAATPADAAQRAVDAWTVLNEGHYPDGIGRTIMDISGAPVDANGESDPTGTHSRYENLQVPTYNLTGWWDIFIDGQISTWQNTLAHVRPEFRPRQKLIIGPWAHQTIGSRSTGDMRLMPGGGVDHRYPPAATEVLGFDAQIDNLNAEVVGRVANSEITRWFRAHLGGEPTVLLPPLNYWQYVLGPLPPTLPDSVFILAPAQAFSLSFAAFFNFVNGADSLRNVPVRVKGVAAIDSSVISLVTIPPLSESLLGDTNRTQLEPLAAFDWDSVPNVRLFVPGPVNDGISGTTGPATGNYWLAADTFPLPDLHIQKLFFRQDGGLVPSAPTADEGTLQLATDPDNPVITHGGPNMIERTPDNSRVSQGQMDFADPQFLPFTLLRDSLTILGQRYTDQLAFTSGAVQDSFSVAGFPIATLFASSKPVGGPQDSTSVDFVVRVLDVYPDGRELYVFEGAVNARAREFARAWAQTGQEQRSGVAFTNIVPDTVYEYQFRTLPIAYTWGHGHRIKVLVTNTNYPRFQANPNIPLRPRDFIRRHPQAPLAYDYFGQTATPRPAIQTLRFSDVYAGNIAFPVLGQGFTLTASPEAQSPLPLRVYPNPAHTQLAVGLHTPGRHTAQLRNLLGQEVRRFSFSGAEARLDVQGLPRGVYVLHVTPAGGHPAQCAKVVLE